MRSHITGRLSRLNARLIAMIPFISAQTQVGVPTPPYPTYTQAKKALKAIPRNIRESYEKSIRTQTKNQVDDIEHKRKEARGTPAEVEKTVSKKQRRESRKEG